jgi:hypothetical protein
VGFLVAHFADLGGAAQGAGWGMCIGGVAAARIAVIVVTF